MPIEFSEFHSMCALKGYTRIYDQRTFTPPEGNIFSMFTRNNVKVEIKVHKQKKITTYVAGEGLSPDKLVVLKNEIELQGMIIEQVNKKHLLIQLSADILNGFFELVNIIEDIDSIAQRQRSNRFYKSEDGDNNFLYIAKSFRLMYELKPMGSPWSRLIIGDALDKLAYAGISSDGKIQRDSGKNPYREHANPMDWICEKIFEMLKNGDTDQIIADMIKRNLKLVLISDQEQDLLDNKLSLRTTMPPGFNDGDDPLLRLKYANITIENI